MCKLTLATYESTSQCADALVELSKQQRAVETLLKDAYTKAGFWETEEIEKYTLGRISAASIALWEAIGVVKTRAAANSVPALHACLSISSGCTGEPLPLAGLSAMF